MKLSQLKQTLRQLDRIAFELPNGELVPTHFHVTEIGKTAKTFIDCGGTMRTENGINFQLWEANDYNHRLHPEKLLDIITLSEEKLDLGDREIEVEYQGATIGKYGLDFNGTNFLLTTKHTDCLAKEQCGISPQTQEAVAAPATQNPTCCPPGSGCC